MTVTSRRCKTLADLSDAVVLFEFMSQMYALPSSPQHFEPSRLKASASNWVTKLGNLRQLMSCLDTYYSQVLQLPLEVVVEGLDLTEIAKRSDRISTTKLVLLVLGAAVKGDQSNAHLGKIVTLNEDSQYYIMLAIKDFQAKCEGYDAPADEAKVLKKENNKLKIDIRKMMYEMEEIQQEVLTLVKRSEEISRERDREKDRADEAENSLAKSKALGSDTGENSAFAIALESHVQAKESQIEDLSNQIAELRKMHAKQIAMLRDENDYQGEQLLRLKDLELAVEKYREKVEELQATKRLNSELQRINENLQNKLAKYEEDIVSLAGWKQSVQLMKEQLVVEKEKCAKLLLSVDEKERTCRETLKSKKEIEEKLQFSEARAKEVNKENERLRYHMDTAKDDLDPNSMSRAFTDAYEAKIHQLESENARIRALAGTEGMLQHLNEQLDSVLLSKAALEEKLRSALGEKQQISAELHELKGTLQRERLEGEGKAADLEQEVETKEVQLQNLSAKATQFEREKAKFEARGREIESLKSENNQHMRDLKALYLEKDAANQRYIACKEELIVAKAQITELQAVLKRSEGDNRSLSEQIASAKSLESERKREIEGLKTKSGALDLTERLKLLEAEKAAIRLNNELSDLRAALKDKDDRIHSLSSDYTSLRDDLKQRLKRQELELQSAHEAEIEDLQKQAKEAEDEVEFQRRLKDDLVKTHNKEQKLMVMALLEAGMLVHRLKYSQERLFRSAFVAK